MQNDGDDVGGGGGDDGHNIDDDDKLKSIMIKSDALLINHLEDKS